MQLLVNDKVCNDMYVVKDLHPQAVAAIREFKRNLAKTHLANLEKTPEDLRDDCFLAHDIKHPGRSLQFGLPIQEQEANGLKRILVDYKQNAEFKTDLFGVPSDYVQMNAGR